ncbi:cytochrome P450 [Mesobaculum littorinae]|uniref:Cytochrome P450 n=1 Tax=Mesobaculum littorinae TaxID=2486419 RepID=A0A438ALD1_9RHOB|nr:cytochrome P450 [Mesobaculum littorinae]RVV99470.1 cytochrome P450 [Mesobaculum littorinae]
MQNIRQSPTDPAFVADPYPFYDRARALGEVVWWEDYDMPVALSHAAVSAALKSRDMGREPPDGPPVAPDHLRNFYAIEHNSMLELEAPRHTRLRGLVLRAFTSRRINGLAPEIEALCHDLIDAFPEGPFDLLPAYADRVPVIVIARLLGVPDSAAADLLRWSHAMVGMYQARRTHADEVAADTAARDFAAFLRDHIARRRTTPGDDLLSHLIAAEDDGARLSTDEMIATAVLLLNAGHEATVHGIGNGVAALYRHADPVATTREASVAATVEEILRFDPPLHLFVRHAYAPVQLGGETIPKGGRIGCLLAAANRDPAVFANPDRFDPTRPATGQMAFGAGPHFCVGAPLARLEMQVALRVLYTRCPELRPVDPPRIADIYHFRGLEALVVDR